MAITTLDGLTNAFPGVPVNFYKPSLTSKGSGTWQSLWQAAGTPAAGATPATGQGAIPTSATTGAIPFNNPSAGHTYLGKLQCVQGQNPTLILYDRLWHNSGLAGNTTLPQSVSSLSLTRPGALGTGVELWGEVYAAMGSTASTFTASYTNQSGVGNNSAVYSMPASALVVGQMFPFTLAAGDTGVSSVQSITLSSSTGTQGNFGLTLLRRIAEVQMNGTSTTAATINDAIGLALPRIYDNACLALMVLCLTTSTGNVSGSANLVYG